MKNKLLTICIPTWNRMLILDEALADIIPKVASYEIELLIADNASNDCTREVVKKYQKIYPLITYHVHEVNCGPDKNFEWVLEESAKRSCYSWILGDSYRIVEDQLPAVLNILEQNNYSLVVVNGFSRLKGNISVEYQDITIMLSEIGWHMTMIGALIFSADIIDFNSFSRYYNTNFIQEGIIFEYFSKHKNKLVYVHNPNTIYASLLYRGENHWQNESLRIFGKNWMSFILSLPPEIPLSAKLKCIKKHNEYIGLFTVRDLYRKKKSGWLDYKTKVLPYKYYCSYVSVTPWIVLRFISKYNYRFVRLFKYPLVFWQKLKCLETPP